MQILFKDFELAAGSAKASPERTIEGAVSRMNGWIAEQQIDVLNVETLTAGGGSYEAQAGYGVRCWYRHFPEQW
jgi:hypothetical protein